MPNYKAKIDEWKNAIDELNKILDEKREEITALPGGKDYGAVVKKLQMNLSSKKNAFDAKRLFVSCFGALKAGKSTLMNALAETYVSPVKSGIETTLRCSVVMPADSENPEGIRFYKFKNNIEFAEDDKQETSEAEFRFKKMAEDILQYFKGAKEWDEIDDFFDRCEPYHLTGKREKLDALTKEYPSEIAPFQNFLIAEIRIDASRLPENSLLHQENIALWDMPGLDGIKANVEKNNPESKIIKEILKNSHYFLFVQSSVTALNTTAKKTLIDCLAERKEVPSMVVFNKISGKNWLTPEFITDEIEKQQQAVTADLREINPEIITVNAAQAWDACLQNPIRQEKDLLEKYRGEKRQTLYDDSNLKTLKDIVQKRANEQADRIIFFDTIEGLRRITDNELKQDSQLKKKERACKDNNQGIQNVFDTCRLVETAISKTETEDFRPKTQEHRDELKVHMIPNERDIQRKIENIIDTVNAEDIPVIPKEKISFGEAEEIINRYIDNMYSVACDKWDRSIYDRLAVNYLMEQYNKFHKRFQEQIKFAKADYSCELDTELYAEVTTDPENVRHNIKQTLNCKLQAIPFGYLTRKEFVEKLGGMENILADIASRGKNFWDKVQDIPKSIWDSIRRHKSEPYLKRKNVETYCNSFIRRRYQEEFNFDSQFKEYRERCFSASGEDIFTKVVVKKLEEHIDNILKKARNAAEKKQQEQKEMLKNITKITEAVLEMNKKLNRQLKEKW